jgi:hypothetical protein
LSPRKIRDSHFMAAGFFLFYENSLPFGLLDRRFLSDKYIAWVGGHADAGWGAVG